MKDNTSLFQMALAPDLFQSVWRAQRDRDAPQPTPSKAVADLEGVMLERWIKDMLACHPRVLLNICSAKPLDSHMADIDGLVRLARKPGMGDTMHASDDDLLLCINAKRCSSNHKPEKFQAIVDEFMDRDCNPDPDVEPICGLAQRHLFVSPQLNPTHKRAIEAAGHLALDIPDLIRELREGWPVINKALAEARRPTPPQPTEAEPEKPAKVAGRPAIRLAIGSLDRRSVLATGYRRAYLTRNPDATTGSAVGPLTIRNASVSAL